MATRRFNVWAGNRWDPPRNDNATIKSELVLSYSRFSGDPQVLMVARSVPIGEIVRVTADFDPVDLEYIDVTWIEKIGAKKSFRWISRYYPTFPPDADLIFIGWQGRRFKVGEVYEAFEQSVLDILNLSNLDRIEGLGASRYEAEATPHHSKE